jgi:hypothetical protein
LKNRFLQVDEVRKEKDYAPMGFNFITLGLGDVLLNHETKQIADGKIKIKLDKDKQGDHKLNADGYKQRIAEGKNPSYTELSYMEI